MFFLDSNGKRYYLGRPFTYGDIQYTAAAATAVRFTDLGFTQVNIQTRPDDAFYIVSGPDDTGAYSSTPRDLNDLKTKYIIQSKLSARALLAKTDWLIIRQEENSNAIPAAVEAFRDQVRTISDDNCTLITGCADVSELEDLIKAPLQIEDPNNQGTFITNTDPHLAGYPDEVSGYDY